MPRRWTRALSCPIDKVRRLGCCCCRCCCCGSGWSGSCRGSRCSCRCSTCSCRGSPRRHFCRTSWSIPATRPWPRATTWKSVVHVNADSRRRPRPQDRTCLADDHRSQRAAGRSGNDPHWPARLPAADGQPAEGLPLPRLAPTRATRPDYTIIVNPRPSVEQLDLRYDYPAYTGLEPSSMTTARPATSTRSRARR